MNRQGKIAVIVLGLVAALSVAVAGGGVMLQMRERHLRIAKERELLLVQSQNQDLEQQLRQATQAKTELEEQLAGFRQEFEQLAQQLEGERQVKAALTKSVDERQREIDRVGKDLEQVRAERASLVEQLAQLRKEQETTQQQFQELQQAKAQLETKVLELSGQSSSASVELEKVVVSGAPPSPAGQPPAPAGAIGRPGAQPASAIQGQVLVVNREYAFIVVNLGKNQGLGVGQELQIVRGQEVLGRAKIEKLYDELSAAAIQPGSKEDAIQEGDIVRAI